MARWGWRRGRREMRGEERKEGDEGGGGWWGVSGKMCGRGQGGE